MQADAQPPLLRPDLLAGRAVVVAGCPGELGHAAAQACAALGAHVDVLAPVPGGGLPVGTTAHTVDPEDEQAVQRLLGELASRRGGLDTLVLDAGEGLAEAPADDAGPLRAGVDACFIGARAAARAALIDAGRGRVITLAPAPRAGPLAAPARAALENLSRTLSIEWTRYGIRTVTISRGATTQPAAVGQLVAFLASPAGDYYAGCVLSLDGPLDSPA